jgi:hypothetical protein
MFQALVRTGGKAVQRNAESGDAYLAHLDLLNRPLLESRMGISYRLHFASSLLEPVGRHPGSRLSPFGCSAATGMTCVHRNARQQGGGEKSAIGLLRLQ